MMNPTIRTYSELEQLATFEERFLYLSLKGTVGEATFGYERWINQAFYRSKQWRDIRTHILARDLGCDLGITGHELFRNAHVHHMNPLSAKEITRGNPDMLDPEFLITTSLRTHNAIHYGDESLIRRPLRDREAGDTKLW